MTLPMLIASVAWGFLSLGVLLCRKRTAHVVCMLFGVALDVSLVLYLQVTRNAMQTALEFRLSTLEQLHILCSSVALFLYAPTLLCAYLFYYQKKNLFTVHKGFGYAAYGFRTLGFLFMFSIPSS